MSASCKLFSSVEVYYNALEKIHRIDVIVTQLWILLGY